MKSIDAPRPPGPRRTIINRKDTVDGMTIYRMERLIGDRSYGYNHAVAAPMMEPRVWVARDLWHARQELTAACRSAA